MAKSDILTEGKELKGHSLEFTLWPRQWQRFSIAHPFCWNEHRLVESEKFRIPNESGIYTLLVQPGIADHPSCSYLMYVGKTKSLRRRFGEYLSRERREDGRPKLYRLLTSYDDYLWFCFSLVPEPELGEVEEGLLKAYIPPFNDQLPAEISRAVQAFSI